jgi:hypothetical protein
MPGKITFFNKAGIELESMNYGNPVERRAIIASWVKDLSKDSGHYYQINPKPEGSIRAERQTIRSRILIEQLLKAS